MTVPLSEMSRDALLYLKRVEQVKFWLAKKSEARTIAPEPEPAAPIRGYVDN